MPVKKATKKEADKTPNTTVDKMKTDAFKLTLQGTSILVVNNLRAKHQIEMIRRRLLGLNVSTKGKVRDPIAEYLAARYLTEDGEDGIPTHGIKLSICSALQFYNDIDMTMARARRIIHVNVGQDITPIKFKKPKSKQIIVFENETFDIKEGDDPSPPIYTGEIDKGLPTMREDIVRLQGGARAPDLRYRPMYTSWECDITVEHPPKIITRQSVLNLISFAGQSIGLCEWRPEKGGQWGMYRIKPGRGK